MAKTRALIRERDGIRGLVPSREFGGRDKVYGSYLNTLNPRETEVVQKALAVSTDARFQEFLNRIMNPKYKRVSLQLIAKACDISLKEFQEFWMQGSTQAAIAVAQTHSIKVTEDMAEDAKSTTTICSRCDGMGFVTCPDYLPETTPGYREIRKAMEIGAGSGTIEPAIWVRNCPNCDKAGKLRKPGDSHSRDRLLEMSGHIKKDKGSGVTIVQNFGGANHSSAISLLDQKMAIDIDSDRV